MSKFTPGPWFVANGNEVHDELACYDEQGARVGNTANRIATVEYPYMDDAGKTANARLIAAAPDLYAALVDQRRLLVEVAKHLGQSQERTDLEGQVHRAFDDLSALIAKAVGQ